MPKEYESPFYGGLVCTTAMSIHEGLCCTSVMNSMYWTKPPEREIDRMERELAEAQARVSQMVSAPEWKGAT